MIIPERRLEEQKPPLPETRPAVEKLLVKDEVILGIYKDLKLVFAFTNRRAIIMFEGASHMECDITSLPYKKLVSYSVRGENYWEVPAKIDMVFDQIGRVKFKIRSSLDLVSFSRLLSAYIL